MLLGYDSELSFIEIVPLLRTIIHWARPSLGGHNFKAWLRRSVTTKPGEPWL